VADNPLDNNTIVLNKSSPYRLIGITPIEGQVPPISIAGFKIESKDTQKIAKKTSPH